MIVRHVNNKTLLYLVCYFLFIYLLFDIVLFIRFFIFFFRRIAKVDGKNLEAASACLSCLFENVCFTYTTNQIAAQVTKVKVITLISFTLNA